MALDLQRDSALFFGDFAEEVRFRESPRDRSRVVMANVNRQAVDDESETPFAGRRPPTLHIMLQSQYPDGVVPSEVQEEESEVEVAYPMGAKPRWRQVLRILRHNPGCILLEVMA